MLLTWRKGQVIIVMMKVPQVDASDWACNNPIENGPIKVTYCILKRGHSGKCSDRSPQNARAAEASGSK